MKQKNSKQKTALEVRLIQSTKEFEALHEAWNRLLEQNHTQSAFLTWEWLFSWWKVYSENKQLWIISVWDANELVGVLPLSLNKEKQNSIPFRTLQPLGSPQSDISGMLVKNNNEQILMQFGDYLIENQRAWDTLELNYYRQDDPAFLFLKEWLLKAGMAHREKQYDYFYISLDESWEDYLATLSRKFRYNLRRAKRLATENGELSFGVFTGNNVTWDVFETVIQINKKAHYPLIYDSPKEQAFHKGLIERIMDKSLIAIFMLSIDGEPLAYEYGFVYNDRYEAWRAGFDTGYDSKISIGSLLSKKMTEKAFELNYKEIDFLRGTESYKGKWKPDVRVYVKNRFIKKTSFLARFIFIQLPKIRARIKQLLKDFKAERNKGS